MHQKNQSPADLREGSRELAQTGKEDLDRLFTRLNCGSLTPEEQVRLGQVLGPDEGIMVQMAMTREEQHFSGPLPHPDVLNAFDPETRRAIVQMAVDEQKHTHDMERKGLEGAIRKDRRGQYFGLAIALAGLAAASFIAPYSALAAGVIAGLDLLGLVSVFVIPRAFERFGPPGKSAQEQSPEDNSEQ